MRPIPKLKFGKPEHGWLPVSIGNHEIHASDAPCDSIQHLTYRILAFLGGSRREVVEWSLEPEYEKWIFQEEEGITSWIIEDHRNEMVLAIHSSRLAISQKITKALKDLYHSHFINGETDDQHWSWSFPHSELTKIELKLADQVGAHNSGGCAPSA